MQECILGPVGLPCLTQVWIACRKASCDGDLVMGEEESALADGMQLVHEVDDSGSFSHVTEDRITVTAELITQDLQAKNGSGHSVRVGVP